MGTSWATKLVLTHSSWALACWCSSRSYWIEARPNVFEEFKVAVEVRREIMECHMVAGGFDYLPKTRSADMTDYRNFAGNVLWQLPGVGETRTYAVMEEVKNSTHLVLPGL
jgi:Lrp/AsnC family leucine-responsive transcriptional regulator